MTFIVNGLGGQTKSTDAARELCLVGLPETISTVQEILLEEDGGETEQAPIIFNNPPSHFNEQTGHYRGRGRGNQ